MAGIEWYIIFTAYTLDFFLGDPRFLPHPVIYMGKAISFFEPVFRKRVSNLFFSGLLFALFLIGSVWVITFLFLQICFAINVFVGKAAEAILLFYCFSNTTLYREAMKVFHSLDTKNLKKARLDLSMIVGRETAKLDEKAITRADIETVAENFVDGFLSPLFFALIGGVPLAAAYKMVNTLDSMVGYRNDTYILFGRASAKIDDMANFIPARLSVFFTALGTLFFSSARFIEALKTGFSQGRLHKSPNAGFPEAAFAGALNIRLGGPSVYHGRIVEKPFIGRQFKNPEKTAVKQACNLMLAASFTAAGAACIIAFLLYP